ncbi:hypothetical protein ACFFS2_17325 [Streptomyces aurantiacus]|uniref:Uncharacterized protein n=1 Tax=Streptomyces aurantiacus TaxID=47760 RepID=A0A7G1PD93_9ACTN|nr:hypothetical protein [Streptomyces aurantiacus]BCL31756.1 hypothetical protein GCM10017557_66150 [Streptomyces aurantiacus]
MSRATGASGSLLGAGAVISCPHGGRASTTTTATSAVLMDGVPVATAGHGYVVTGCPHTVDGVPVPCVSVRWTADGGTGGMDGTGGSGVTVDGAAVLLDTSAAQCFTAAFVPQGPPVVQAAPRKVTVR